MDALRRRGVVARLRAFVLLIVVLFGSILARDALFVAQCEALLAEREAAVEELEDAPRLVDPLRKAKLKLRPSGLSKRAAWCPFDHPADDDETDEDSDTFPPKAMLAVLAPEPPRVGPRLALEIAEQHAIALVVVSAPFRTAVSSRGPPGARSPALA